MDIGGIAAFFLAVVLLFVVGSLRKRIGRVESVVMRLQNRIEDLARSSDAAEPGSDAAPSPIDIEPFVD